MKTKKLLLCCITAMVVAGLQTSCKHNCRVATIEYFKTGTIKFLPVYKLN